MLTNAIYPFVAVVGQEQLKKAQAEAEKLKNQNKKM